MIEPWTRVLTMAPASRRDASEAPESMHVIVVIDAGDACVTAVFLGPAADDARSFAPIPYLGCIPSIDGAGVATAAVSLAVWDDGTAMVMVSMGVDWEVVG